MQSQFEREELQAPLSEINMTPLVDVMLVLMVIFLVTAPMINSAINLNLPKESAAHITDKKAVSISINQNGEYFLNDKIISISALEDELKSISKTDSKRHVHIRADIDVSYGKVSRILGIAQNIGLSNIGFVTEPK